MSTIDATTSTNFKIESVPPELDTYFHVLPTGIKEKLLIIDIGCTANCWLYHKHKYELIGSAPRLRHDYDTSLQIIQIDHLSTNDILTFFAFTTEQFDCCYIVKFNNITNEIQWNQIGNDKQIDDCCFDWHFYAIECTIAKFGNDQCLIVPGYKDKLDECPLSTKSIFSVDMTNNYEYTLYEIANVLPFEIISPILINITRNCQIVKNEYLLLTENKSLELNNSKRNVAFTLNIKNGIFNDLECKQIETYFLGHFKNTKKQRGMFAFGYFLFNDYLIGFDGDTCGKYNECHIFSFKKMKWIAYFTIDLVWQQTKIIIHYGIVQIYAHPDWRLRNPNEIGLKHYSFDIGNAFNYRNQMFYAIMNGLKRNKYVYLEDELSKFIFDFIDDGCIVKYFDKPWEIQNSFGVNRHKIWDVLESFVIDCGSIISFNHTLDFIKLLFNYVDEINIEKNNLHKPWVNSYQQLYNQ
eukprot:516315_1